MWAGCPRIHRRLLHIQRICFYVHICISIYGLLVICGDGQKFVSKDVVGCGWYMMAADLWTAVGKAKSKTKKPLKT